MLVLSKVTFGKVMMGFIYVILIFLKLTYQATALNTALKALENVFEVSKETCNAGTREVLSLKFDESVWNKYTDTAIRTSNFLSSIIAMNNGTLDSLTDDLFFLLVRNNVQGETLIFGSAIALEKGIYSKYDKFCPYAHKTNGSVHSHDIAVNYDYRNNNTIWYTDIRAKTWENVDIVTDDIMYRMNDKHLPEVEVSYPVAKLSDGHWTIPYFDCGGGNVWMVTYASPIFGVQNESVLFKGIASIDIELTHIDINQCDSNADDISSGLDAFRGSHLCQSTTMCVPIKDHGFVTGAYSCECNDGYYLGANGNQSYSGRELEDYVRQFGDIETGMFQCAACAAGCNTCVDSSPCLYENNDILKYFLFILTLLSAVGILSIAVVITVYRDNKVIKSSSPTFLVIMCIGGILQLSQSFIRLFETTAMLCTFRIWPMHIGFFSLYGSLVIKTWRISKIFTVGTRKRLQLQDKVLYQRIGLLLCFAVTMLTAWTMSKQIEVIELKTSDNLIFHRCQYGPFLYAVVSAEIVLLLYGVYLSFTVRKAPAQFSDKYMAYAIYNAIILGSIMSLLSLLLISVINPDMTLVFEFLRLQVFATVTLLIICVPKLLAVVKQRESSCKSTPVVSLNSGVDTMHRITKRPSTINTNVNCPDFSVNIVKTHGNRQDARVSDKETQTY